MSIFVDMKDPNRGKPYADKQARITDVQELISQNRQFAPFGVRSLYYLLISNPLFEQRHWRKRNGTPLSDIYTKVIEAVAIARIRGDIAWHLIVDDTRIVTNKTGRHHTFRDAAPSVVFPVFDKCLAMSQDVYIEVWVEKNGLVHIVKDVADKYCRRVVGCKGYPSLDVRHKYVQRCLANNKEINLILYYGDLDPAGWNIPQTIKGSLISDFDMGANFKMLRGGVNPEHVKQYDLVPMPDKPRSSVGGIVDEFKGDTGIRDVHGYELDGLPFDALQKLVETDILEFTDQAQYSKDLLEIDEGNRKLTAFAMDNADLSAELDARFTI